MKRIGALALLLVTLMPEASAWAHGVVGDYVFLEPLIAQDPTPANELDIIEPTWTKTVNGQTFAIPSSIEKVLYRDKDYWPRFSVGVGSAWDYISPKQGTNRSGFDDLNMFAKWAFLVWAEHEFLMSVTLNIQLPTGNPTVEGQNHTSLGPGFLWEKGLGDIPNWPLTKYLRPLGFQGGVLYLPALGGHTSHPLFYNQVIEYSIPYLSNSVKDIGLKWPLRNLFPFTEINYSQFLAGPPGTTFPIWVLTPGIAYVSYHGELSIGTQFALNRAAVPGTHAAVIVLLDIFYDSIFVHWGNWTVNDIDWRLW